MIVVKLIGGLGNQMFQYAAGKTLSLARNTDLFLDLSGLENENKGFTKRGYELHHFQLSADLADEKIRQSFALGRHRWVHKIKSFFPRFCSSLVFNESDLNFQAKFFKLPANTYLNGYWQDLKYFELHREVLLRDFKLINDSPAENYFKVLHEIENKNSVSLHVRRGDYVSLSSASDYHGNLGLPYYQEAIRVLQNKYKGLHFFVFSDDMAWCRENLNFLKEVTFIDGEKENLSAQQELILMSACRHHVIANSSFSWWGAWLNKNPGKMVIAPKHWYNKKYPQPKNLLPADWHRL